MAFSPGQNNDVLQQEYKTVIFGLNLYGTYTLQYVPLGNFTASTPCIPGLVLALSSSGPNAGTYINWVDSGTNGQGQAVGVLVDQYLSTSPSQLGNSAYMLISGSVYASALVVTTGSTLSDALPQMNAVAWISPAGQTIYNIRGSVVAIS